MTKRPGTPLVLPARESLTARSPKLPLYLHPTDRRRLRRARIRALERERGLPVSIPWDDSVDGDRTAEIFDRLRESARLMPRRVELPGMQRILERTEIRDCGYETPCWIWTGCRDRREYGQIRVGGPAWLVHRYAYEHLVGSVAAGLHLHHRCENPPCWCPDHLEPLTPLEHAQHGSKARQTHCIHGHEFTPENTSRRLDRRGRLTRRCLTCHRLSERRYARRRAGLDGSPFDALEASR